MQVVLPGGCRGGGTGWLWGGARGERGLNVGWGTGWAEGGGVWGEVGEGGGTVCPPGQISYFSILWRRVNAVPESITSQISLWVLWMRKTILDKPGTWQYWTSHLVFETHPTASDNNSHREKGIYWIHCIICRWSILVSLCCIAAGGLNRAWQKLYFGNPFSAVLQVSLSLILHQWRWN